MTFYKTSSATLPATSAFSAKESKSTRIANASSHSHPSRLLKLALASFLSIASLSSLAHASDIRVGATPVPAAEILEFAKPLLAKKGIKMQVQSFTDYITPNIALNDKNLDATLHQHKPFMDRLAQDRKLDLVSIAPIYVVPLGFYSKKYKTLESIPNGATIAIPNDPTNYSRALILLHDNGIITLKNPQDLACKESDIIKNPRKFKFKPVDAATLPRVLDGIDAAVVNANYALQAKMSVKESFFHENEKSAYINVLVARSDNAQSKEVQALKEVLLSKEVADWIAKKYNGEIIHINSQK
ncbi:MULTISPECIES: MetQ/NlpA family ABC transporter substrate-binding protein [unclassified Helicobacter]|uniref:MetQ/NlpA family ABC transporter substrate-binding protein n=1 Tax=unclassified Helicobacter TaxID=2593540 RepID=UPI000B1A7664|nr:MULTISPECIES: MetQ/NlpA family ABC transporter substrate-binding protein [unclassified Helicobacter]